MNTSKTKIKKIQEANLMLEQRFFLKEQFEDESDDQQTTSTSTPTNTQQTPTGPASTTNKHIGLLSLLKYKDNLKNIIETMNSVLGGGGQAAKQQFCGDNGAKLQEGLKPVFQLIDDLITQLKVDAERKSKRQYTEGEVIKMLYNTFNGNIASLMTTIGSHLPQKPLLITDVVVGLQTYLRNKYGQDGALLSSVLSGILGKLGTTYQKLC